VKRGKNKAVERGMGRTFLGMYELDLLQQSAPEKKQLQLSFGLLFNVYCLIMFCL
jgi:hypothetical protein